MASVTIDTVIEELMLDKAFVEEAKEALSLRIISAIESMDDIHIISVLEDSITELVDEIHPDTDELSTQILQKIDTAGIANRIDDNVNIDYIAEVIIDQIVENIDIDRIVFQIEDGIDVNTLAKLVREGVAKRVAELLMHELINEE